MEDKLRYALWASFVNRFGTDETITHVKANCSTWNAARSSHQQYKQLGIFTKEQSNEEVMMEILNKYANPCKACTTVEIGKAYIPENHKYVVNRNALNGWVFQGHFDCVAAAMVAGIHSVYGVTREERLYAVKDLVQAMKTYHAEGVRQFVDQQKKSNKGLKWQRFYETMSGLLQSDNVEKRGEISRSQFHMMVLKELKSNGIATHWCMDPSSSFYRHLYQLYHLRLLNVTTSYQQNSDFIEYMNIGLKLKVKKDYTFEFIKEMLANRNVSVMISLPAHLALVFAAGEDKDTGRYKHLLVGRPSGGQSPCGWIPFSLDDRFPGEVLWEMDIDPEPAAIQEALRTGRVSPEELQRLANSDRGVTTFEQPFIQRPIYIFSKDYKFAGKVDTRADYKSLPWWLQDANRMECEDCALERNLNGTIDFDAERLRFLHENKERFDIVHSIKK